MQFTGENFIPEISKKRLVDEHVYRYDFAKNYVKDSIVLDIACGSGYGAYRLSKNSKKVIGVDISEEIINYAKKNFKNNNLEFIRASAVDEKLFLDNSFDFICSFETIEHFNSSERKQYLKNLHKWLKPGGYILFSTPNKKNNFAIFRYSVK